MLVPARLRLPAALADRWPGVVARAGVRVIRTGRKAVLACGATTLVLHVDDAADGSTCDLSLVTDTTWRRRLEAIFLASGASLEDPSLVTPVVRALYRIDDAAWPALAARWRGEDARVGRTAWDPAAEPFPALRLEHGGAHLDVETGPAMNADGSPARYVDFLPRFLLTPGRALRDLLGLADGALRRAGAVPVLGFTDSPSHARENDR